MPRLQAVVQKRAGCFGVKMADFASLTKDNHNFVILLSQDGCRQQLTYRIIYATDWWKIFPITINGDISKLCLFCLIKLK